MNKKLCFFLQVPLTKRDYERFGIEVLQKRGFKIEFLDMTRLLYPEYLENYQPVGKIAFENITICKSRCDVVKYLTDNRDLFGLNLVDFRYSNLFLFRLLKKYNIQYAGFYSNAIPTLSRCCNAKGHFIQKAINVLQKIKRLNKTTVCNHLFRFSQLLPPRILQFQPPKFIFVGAAEDAKNKPRLTRCAEIIWAHTLDYDLHLDYNLRNPESLIQGDYAVFLDEFFPLHPDFSIKGFPGNPFDEFREYYDELNMFFFHLESRGGIPIVIAAHPRSQYEKMSDLFGGREVFRNRTISLVAGAKYVLAHGSTSINFAVLFNKPIIFLLPSKAKDGYFGRFIRYYAKQFGKTPQDINSILNMNFDKELSFDKRLYSVYMENYIKRPDSPKKFFWDIVADTIRDKLH